MLFSIITINRNNAAELDKTISSVVALKKGNFEFIVIDGNSTDNSLDIIHKYEEHIDYYISEPDSGIYNAMNKGLAVAKGDFVIFMNSGDQFDNSNALYDLENHDMHADVIFCSWKKTDGQKILQYCEPEENITLYKLLYHHGCVCHQATFVRTNVMKELGGFDEDKKIVSDTCFLIKAFVMYGKTYKNISVCTTKSLVGGVSDSQKALLQIKLEFKSFIDKNLPYLSDDYERMNKLEKFTLRHIKRSASWYINRIKNLFTIYLSALLFLIPAFVSAQTDLVIKNAEEYGFSIENDGEENADALQAALNGGGRIIVNNPGEYKLSKTIFIDSNTELIFKDNVVINKSPNKKGVYSSYLFINRNAYERKYDTNIYIEGLNVKVNEADCQEDIERITGLVGVVSFFYVKNLHINRFELLDGGSSNFVIQVCTFKDILIENVHIEARKDGIHLGRGENFVIRNCCFLTYDDPIALNAHDYNISNPELGDIKNGLIENCYDLDAPDFSGFFCRILAGAWPNWEPGMEFQNSDAVISENKIYRLKSFQTGETLIESKVRPSHKSGIKTYPDGLTWEMTQENDIVDHCSVKNVVFRKIYLQRTRHSAFSFHFDKNEWSRSYYPNCTIPVHQGIVLDSIYQLNEMNQLIVSRAPIDTILIKNSEIRDSYIQFFDIKTEGCNYDTQYVKFDNVLFCGKKDRHLILVNREGLDIDVEFNGCKILRKEMNIYVESDVDLIKNDISYNGTSGIFSIKKFLSNNTELYIHNPGFVYFYDLKGCLLFKRYMFPGNNLITDIVPGIYIISYDKNFIIRK